MIIKTEEKAIEHPLETMFDIEPGTTMVEYREVLPEKPVEMPNYDQKDDEIEMKLEEIYGVAMGQVSLVADEMERVEGKYKARIGEVTATMLNVALGAVREKRQMKEHKDKLSPIRNTIGDHNTITNNNVVVADRNELLRMFANKD
ncbi:MAG: hypothetical protein CTY12_00080 [Methylotenera sp.]|nr:MAG: hypothetical protein CTY12_00080 [Methylotenera sp.]